MSKQIFALIFAAQVAHAFTAISSSYNGLQLSNEAGLARLTKWSESNSLSFEGYGQIKMQELCLSANQFGIATWKPCIDGNKGQIWSLKDGQLKNERGSCAEAESYNDSVLNPKIKTRKCSDSHLQKWKSH